MNKSRVLLLIVLLASITTLAQINKSVSMELLLSKFEVHDSILVSAEQIINEKLNAIQNELYAIKATNSSAFECVESYGDLIPIEQLRSSFHKCTDEYLDRKEIIIGYFNSNVSFHITKY